MVWSIIPKSRLVVGEKVCQEVPETEVRILRLPLTSRTHHDEFIVVNGQRTNVSQRLQYALHALFQIQSTEVESIHARLRL